MTENITLITVLTDHKCGGYIGLHQGFIRSPNWPGDYPANVDCKWTIKPAKGRRILIVIPEIDFPTQPGCGDSIVMRKSGEHLASRLLRNMQLFELFWTYVYRLAMQLLS